jgi:hypothetical protein
VARPYELELEVPRLWCFFKGGIFDFNLTLGWEPKEIKGLLETVAENNRAPQRFLALLPDPRPVPANYPWTGVCLLQKAK